MKVKKVLLTALVSLFFLTICFNLFAGAQQAEKPKFYVLAHGGITNPFWQRTQKGVEDAAKELGVEAEFLAPREFSVKELVDMVEMVIAANPDGIACTITIPEALDAPLRKAIKMGIPVIAIDMEDLREDRIPYIGFVGWNNYQIGVVSANKVLDELKVTPRHVVIGVHEAGHVGLELRAKGLIDTFEKRVPGIKIEKLQTTVDMAKGMSVYDAYLTAHPDVDMIFTTGSASGHPGIKLLEEKGLGDKIVLVTTDLSSEIIDAIKRGTVAFTTDCQQYLWGWLSVVLLYKYDQYGMIPASPAYTGPSVVDKSNVDEVADLVKQGIR